MVVRLGINPLTWTNDDMPELGGATPLETCLAEARLAGYAGVELGNKFPRTAEALRPVLARHGLALVSGWYGARLLERDVEAEMAAAESHIALLAAMGAAAQKVSGIAGLETALPKALVAKRTQVIVIDTDPQTGTAEGGAWWEVPVAAAPATPAQTEARRDYETQRKRQAAGA